MRTGNMVFSTQGYIITQSYVAHVTAVNKGAYAQGIDLVSQHENRYCEADIVAHSAGTVIYAGDGDGYGQAVWILHDGNIVTGYGHMKELRVKAGDEVKAGQSIGVIGNTGNSTGIHLHFEVRRMKPPYKVDADDFWGRDSFMNTSKFEWIDPTPYINAELPDQGAKTIYRVQTGSYYLKSGARNMYNKLVKDGYRPICKYYRLQYHIQAGAYEVHDNAVKKAAELNSKGYATYITTDDGKEVRL